MKQRQSLRFYVVRKDFSTKMEKEKKRNVLLDVAVKLPFLSNHVSLVTANTIST